MTLKQFLLAELEREVERSRRALEQAPAGKYDWKPHEKSMIFGYLANMVATIPTWVAMQINQDELDVAPVDGGQMKQERLDGSEDLLKALDKAAENARSAFEQTERHDSHAKQLKPGLSPRKGPASPRAFLRSQPITSLRGQPPEADYG